MPADQRTDVPEPDLPAQAAAICCGNADVKDADVPVWIGLAIGLAVVALIVAVF